MITRPCDANTLDDHQCRRPANYTHTITGLDLTFNLCWQHRRLITRPIGHRVGSE